MREGGPLASKEARWAVSQAIDRQAIVDVVYEGLSSVPRYPSSESMADFEERFANMHDTYTIGYNPDRAKSLAEQTGLTSQTLRLITNGSQEQNTIAEIIQANLLDIGVKAEIVNYDQATYFSILMDANNFDIALFTPSAPSMLAVDVMAMYLTFIPLGWTGPVRDQYMAMAMDAISTYDPKERNDKLYEALKIFVEEDPWFSLCEVVSSRAINPNLTGIEPMITGIFYYYNLEFTA